MSATCRTLLVCLLLATAAAAETLPAPKEWREFRSRHPYHTNVIALTPAAQDGSRLLIVAEPPPHVKLPALQALKPAVLSQASVQEWPIGWNGLVRDIVVALPRLSADELRNTLATIEQYTYGSTYKAAVIEEPEGDAPPLTSANLRVSAAEIRSWVTGGAVKFSTLFGETPKPLLTLLKGGARGVFYSKPDGMVAWLVPRSGALAPDADIRQFSVDSDLIVGAVAGQFSVAILARQRLLSQAQLPPLRNETIKLLASVQNDSLAQSYARRYLFAGKYDDTHDWAPAYLCDELIDTEYGSLLNIADQLLKSWSDAGTVTYEGFPYAKPEGYPFDKALVDLVKLGDEGLTFNWNTRGAGYTVRQGELAYYAVNRTGSLPVSYFAAEGASTEKYERTAYDWFSSRSDPYLVRVVQYASLYQIFRAFRTPVPTQFASRQPDVRKIAELLYQLLKNQDELTGVVVKAVPDVKEDAEGLRDTVGALKKDCGDESLKQVAAILASPDAASSPALAGLRKKPKTQWTKADQCAAESLVLAQLISSDEDVRELLIVETTEDLDEWMAVFEKMAERSGEQWIRTPSIVVSQNDEKHEKLTGGHNLDAAVTRFREGEVEAGTIKVLEENGQRIIVVNKADLAKLGTPRVLRAASTRTTTGELRTLVEHELRAAPVAPVREMPEALAQTKAAIDRAAKIEETPATLPLGWRVRRGSGIAAVESSEPAGRVTVQLVKKSASQYELRFPHSSSSTVDINGMASIQDAVSHAVRNMFPEAKEIRVVASNFEPQEAGNVLESTRIALKGEGVESRTVAVLDKRSIAANESFARIATEGDLTRTDVRWTLQETGAREYQAEFTVEVPTRSPARSFWVRVKALFKGERPVATALNELASRIRAIFTASPADLTFERASERISAVIKERASDSQVNMELFDVLVSTREPLNGERQWDWARLDPPTVHSSSASR